MKVAAFLHAYPPDRLAGADLMSADLLEALAEAGHEVTVFSTQPCRPGMRGGVLVENRHLYRKVDGWSVIYSHPDVGDAPAHHARRIGVPYVATVHNVSPNTGRYLRNNPPTLTVWNAHATRAAHGGEGGIVVRSPLRVADHQWADRSRATATTLVNLSQAKGSDLFYALAARGGRDYLGVEGAHGVQDKRPDLVEVLPQVPHQLMPDLVWARTRVLLMPSEAESWGRVGVEAMCSGIPVIAHPTLGLLEALGPAGLFVDRDDLVGWAKALSDLNNPIAYGLWSSAAIMRAREVEAQSLADRDLFVARVEGLA